MTEDAAGRELLPSRQDPEAENTMGSGAGAGTMAATRAETGAGTRAETAAGSAAAAPRRFVIRRGPEAETRGATGAEAAAETDPRPATVTHEGRTSPREGPHACPAAARGASAAAQGLAAADQRGSLVARAGAAAAWRATAHVEPDAAGTAVARTADADVPEPVREGAAKVRGLGLRVPAGTPNAPRVQRE